MSRPIKFHELSRLSPAERQRLLKRTEADLSHFMPKVQHILDEVRTGGDKALLRFARELDRARIEDKPLAATEAEFDAAEKLVPAQLREALDFAAGSIKRFHADQMPEEMWLHEIRPGAFAGDRIRPIPSVACYVPRGKGSFPSVALMTTLPAKIAGVKDVAIITPPGSDGTIDAATLFAARLAGVGTVYRTGGAQAIAAVAYGTETVRQFSKVIGPGSPWVAAAKRLLAHVIDTGTPAGPSELIVLADESTDGRLAGLDLLIESEHGPDSSAYLVTWSREIAEAAARAIPEYWKSMSEQRVAFSADVLSGPVGGIILARDKEEALAFVNDYAPEHLQILSKEPFQYLGAVEHAGEILLGEHTPATLGNFVIGPNHVLPTSGWAKTASPVSVHDFLKRTSLAYVTSAGYPELARHARTLARYEGFDAHANAVSPMRDRLVKD